MTTYSSTVVRMMICYSNKDTFRQKCFFFLQSMTRWKVSDEEACLLVKGQLSAHCRRSGGCSKCLTPFKKIIRGEGGRISPLCSFLLKEIAEGQGVVCGLCSTSLNEITRQQESQLGRFFSAVNTMATFHP